MTDPHILPSIDFDCYQLIKQDLVKIYSVRYYVPITGNKLWYDSGDKIS